MTGDMGKITTFVDIGDGISVEESFYPFCGMTTETTVTPPDGLRPAVKVQPDTYLRQMFDRPFGDHR